MAFIRHTDGRRGQHWCGSLHCKMDNLQTLCVMLGVSASADIRVHTSTTPLGVADPGPQELQMEHKHLAVVPRPSAGRHANADDWAALQRQGKQRTWYCMCCPKNKTQCPHVSSANRCLDPDVTISGHCKAAAADVESAVDPVTGKWKLNCISAQPIPRYLHDHEVYQRKCLQCLSCAAHGCSHLLRDNLSRSAREYENCT